MLFQLGVVEFNAVHLFTFGYDEQNDVILISNQCFIERFLIKSKLYAIKSAVFSNSSNNFSNMHTHIWRACHTDKLKISVFKMKNEGISHLSWTKCDMIRIYCLQSICLHIFSLTISTSAWLLLLLLPCWSNSNTKCALFCVTFISHSFFLIPNIFTKQRRWCVHKYHSLHFFAFTSSHCCCHLIFVALLSAHKKRKNYAPNRFIYVY